MTTNWDRLTQPKPRHPKAKLKNYPARILPLAERLERNERIKKLAAEGLSSRQISRLVGLTHPYVWLIMSGQAEPRHMGRYHNS